MTVVHTAVWYTVKLLRESILRVLITRWNFFLLSFHCTYMRWWMSAEPIVVNVHQYLYIKPPCCTPYTSAVMYGHYFSMKLEKEDWLSLGSPQSRAWAEELGAESLGVRRSRETQMREREKGEPIKGISVRSWGSISLGTLWEMVWDVPQNHLRNLQCLSSPPVLEGSQEVLILPHSQVIPLSSWGTSLEQWFSDHQQQQDYLGTC